MAEEALAIGIYPALVARDFRSGVLLAATHSGDSDSTASICGNLLGALGGLPTIPSRWIEQLDVANSIRRICDDWEYVSNNEPLVVHDDWVADELDLAYPPAQLRSEPHGRIEYRRRGHESSGVSDSDLERSLLAHHAAWLPASASGQ
jgi:hypothetical protein